MNAVAEYLAAHHERLGLAALGVPRRPSCVLVTPRFRLSRHVVVLVLGAHGRPALVAKLPRLARHAAGLAHEARNLRAVASALADPDRGTVPTLVAFDDAAAHPLLLETALEGRPLSPRVVRRDRDAIVAEVAGWLGRLAAATATTERGDDWYERLVGAPLRALAHGDSEVAAMARDALGDAEVLRTAGLPLVFEHGDLAHPNLLRQPDGQLGVLDWERGDPAGLPARDLVFLVGYAAMGDVRGAFFGPRPWAWPVVERYAVGLGLDRALLRPLLAVCCARVVGREEAVAA
jgi:aminoglycoside phosphotransferase (APT) family kinase protein